MPSGQPDDGLDDGLPADEDLPEFLRPKEAAKALGLAIWGLRSLEGHPDLRIRLDPAYRLPTRGDRRFARPDVERVRDALAQRKRSGKVIGPAPEGAVRASRAARMLGVSASTVHRLTRSGVLRSCWTNPSRGDRWYLPEDIEQVRASMTSGRRGVA